MSGERLLAITYLLPDVHEPWGGVQTVLREADALGERGHRVTVLSGGGRPRWHEPSCDFREVRGFGPDSIPQSDLVVGTYCPTVPPAWRAGRGRPVHYCQGYEGDNPEHAAQLHLIERIYALEDVAHIAISRFLARRLALRFGFSTIVVPYGIQDSLFTPAEPRIPQEDLPLRVGLVGPFEVPWKDIRTGIAAVHLVEQAGRRVELLRVSPSALSYEERAHWGSLAVEWHEGVPLAEMSALYRSLDVFCGTSTGGAEGFFLPAIEAMACGVPCVLSDIDCFRDYSAAADYAQFVGAGEPAAFADAILAFDRDARLRARMREAGLACAALHGFARHVDGVEEAFSSLVPEGRALSEGGGTQPWWSQGEAARARAFLRENMLESAVASFTAGDEDFAVETLRAAETMFDDHPFVAQQLGFFLARRNDFDGAETALLRAQELDPASPCTARALATLYHICGKADAAVDAMRRARANGLPEAVPCAC